MERMEEGRKNDRTGDTSLSDFEIHQCLMKSKTNIANAKKTQ